MSLLFCLFSVLRTPTVMGTQILWHQWPTPTDRWTCVPSLVVPNCYTRVERTRKTNIVGCAGTEPSDTTLMPYLASPVKLSSGEMHQKDW